MMAADNELSYKQYNLKPCKIVLSRLGQDQLDKYKVLHNYDRINEPNVSPSLSRSTSLSSISVIDDDIIHEEIDELNITTAEKTIEPTDSKEYKCIFCKANLQGFAMAFVHYQYHIDYLPYQCFICEEPIINLNLFIDHAINKHSDEFKDDNEKKMKFIKKQNFFIEKWITSFLNDQQKPTSIWQEFPQDYCPACEWDKDKANQHKEKKKNPLRILQHIHTHLKYLPYECIPCRHQGKETSFAVIDNAKCRSHLLNCHRELLENDISTHKVFQKRNPIPRLEEFIKSYLFVVNVNTPFFRPFIKKITPKEIQNIEAEKERERIKQLVKQQQPEATYSRTNNSVQNQPGQSLLQAQNYKPKLQKPQNESPFRNYRVNYLLAPNINLTNKALNNLKRKYVEENVNITGLALVEVLEFFCVFCDIKSKFKCRLEAYSHYAKHFNYRPIVCLLCQDKFYDLDDLQQHNQMEHPQLEENQLYFIKEDYELESWIDEFLSFQNKPKCLAMISYTEGAHCPVCKRLSKDDNKYLFTNIYKEDDYSKVTCHLRIHINYHPYVCTICKYENVVTKFCLNDQKAVDHLIYYHKYTEPKTVEYLKDKVIVKMNSIDFLESFIQSIEYPLFKKQSNLPRSTKTADQSSEILKRKLKKIIPDLMMNKKSKTDSPNALTSLLNKPVKSNANDHEVEVISIDDSFGDGFMQSPISKIKQQQQPTGFQLLSEGLPNNSLTTTKISPTSNPTPITNSTLPFTTMNNNKSNNELVKIAPRVESNKTPQQLNKKFHLLTCIHCGKAFLNTKQMMDHFVNEHIDVSTVTCMTKSAPPQFYKTNNLNVNL